MTRDPTEAVLPLALTLTLGIVIFSLLWLIHVRRRDASLVDYWWAAGFAATAWIEVAFAPRLGAVQIFVTAAVTVWAVRLTSHMVTRHIAKGGIEDKRYAALRAAGGPGWERRNLFTIFWLQAVVQWLLAAPIHVTLLGAPVAPPTGIGPVAIVLGVCLFLTGFVIEAVADAQLARHGRRYGSGRSVFTGGLWAWSRHPNYFGEAVLWWGLGLVAAGETGQWWVLVAPAALTLILLKGTGIPPLEALMRDRLGWAAYAASTSAFVPLPPRVRRAEPSREGAE